MIPIKTTFHDFIKDLVPQCTITTFDYTGSKMKADGSTIYLKSNDNHYLISAAHVFDSFQSRVGVQLNEQALIPRGRLFISQNKYLTQDERLKDKTDIGILRLDPVSSQKVSEIYTKPISIKDIEVSSSPLEADEMYLICGTPSTNKFVDIRFGTGSIFLDPLAYYTREEEIDYSSVGYNKSEHILLNNDTHVKERIDGIDIPHVKSLQGMSGCGLWKIGNKTINGQSNPYARLVGITNFNYVAGEHNFIVATRIDYITEILRIHFEESIDATSILSKESFCSSFAGFD